MNLTYKKADRIIAVSKEIKKVLEEDFSIQPEKAKAIYNPVPLEEIREKSQEGVEHPFFKDENAFKSKSIPFILCILPRYKITFSSLLMQ